MSDSQTEQSARLLNAWQTPKGWRDWSAVNNLEVGLWYTLTAFAFFLFGGVLALVMYHIVIGRFLLMIAPIPSDAS